MSSTALPPPIGIEGHQQVILEPGGVFGAPEHLRGGRIGDIADHHPDHAGAPDFQAARQVIRLVIELLNDPQHTILEPFTHRHTATQDVRNGPDRHPRAKCDFPDRRHCIL